MALALVQSAIGSNGNSASTTTRAATFTTNVTIGNTIVACIRVGATDADAGTLADTLGHTYALQQVSTVSASTKVAIFTAPVTAAGACTVTFTAGSANVMSLAIAEVSSATPLTKEAGAGGSGTSATFTGSTVTTSVDTILFAFVFGLAALDTWTVGGGFTQIQTTAFSSVTASLVSRTASAGSYAPVWNNSASRAYEIATVAFRESAPAAESRVSQLVAETLSYPTPDARTTQLVVETLSSLSALAPPDARLSQLVVELLTESPPPLDTLVTQLVVETLSDFIVDAEVTQLVVETLTDATPSPIRVSQASLEILDQYPTTTRVSQSPVETVQQWTAPLVGARLSQAPLEILYPFGCYVYVPPACPETVPVDVVGAGGSCPAGLLP
jgi:hypothetical protein